MQSRHPPSCTISSHAVHAFIMRETAGTIPIVVPSPLMLKTWRRASVVCSRGKNGKKAANYHGIMLAEDRADIKSPLQNCST